MKQLLLPLLCVVLSLLSLTTLHSVANSLLLPQFLFFILGFGLFIVVSQQKAGWLFSLSPVWYVVVVILLITTLLVGTITRGSTRWITVAGVNVQASQLVVPVTLLLLGRVATLKKPPWNGRLLTTIALIIGVPAGLIFIEPNLSTTSIFVASCGAAITLTCLTPKQIGVLVLSGLIALSFGWNILKPYQKDRITSFMSGTLSNESNYHARQSLIAVGSGQLWGRGLGQGVQSHLRFLPERQTDFIFASLAEELGLVGSLLLLGTYFSLILTLLFAAQRAQELSHQLFLYGAGAFTLFQTTIHIGMNTGLLPITGVTLPLVSYGGSSVISLLFLYGCAQHCITHLPQKTPQHFE